MKKQETYASELQKLLFTGLGSKVVSAIGHNYLKRTQIVKLTSKWFLGDYQRAVVCS